MSDKPLVIIAAENLASNRIIAPLLRSLSAEIAAVILVPNLARSTSREWKRAWRLVASASFAFSLFKFFEIYLHGALARWRGSTIAQAAHRAGVPVFRFPSSNDEGLLACLRDCAPKVLVSAGPAILSRKVLAVPTVATLNCHGARLPEYRGAANYVWMLLAGETVAYSSIQVMHYELDTGPVIAEKSLTIHPGWSAYRLNFELSGLGGDLYAETIRTVLAAGLPGGLPRSQAEIGNRGFPRRADIGLLRRKGRALFRWRELWQLV